jgi:CTP synthase (UTP-ammonia lyase)
LGTSFVFAKELAMPPAIALIGDYNRHVTARTAIPKACQLALSPINYSWIATAAVEENPTQLKEFSGIWLVPGSPYTSMQGALVAVQFARENRLPFLGTCGGFQHALIEYARNVCGDKNANHAETAADSADLIITPLVCSLIEKNGEITFTPGSLLHTILNGETAAEAYHCQYGLNQAWQKRLEDAGLHFTGFDENDSVRAFEFPDHPFFVGTLFQTERAALQGKQHPIVAAFFVKVLNVSTLKVTYANPDSI